MQVKLKSDVGTIAKGSVVELQEGNGYFYIKEGGKCYTVNPKAHEDVLPKYIHRTSGSSNYHLAKNYSVNGSRYRIMIPGYRTVSAAKKDVYIIESIERTVDKIAQQARDLHDENKKLKKEIEQLESKPVSNYVVNELDRLMKENAAMRYELELYKQEEKLNEILGGKQ